MTTTSFPVIQIEKTGKRLRNMRKEKGIRVAAVCEYMGGISEQAVYKWERGECLPTIDNLLALSHLYHADGRFAGIRRGRNGLFLFSSYVSRKHQ